jgi:hypothetical protein
MRECKLQFSLAKHLIILPVYVNDQGPFNFILDTGAGHSMLSKYATRRLKLKTSLLKRKKGLGVGGIVTLESTVIDSLKLGDITFKNYKVFVLDQSNISQKVRKRIYGIIGYDILSNFEIIINYTKKEVIFH